MSYQSQSEPRYVQAEPRYVEAGTPRPVVEEVVTRPAVAEQRVATTGRAFAPDSFVVGLVGLALLVIGLIAMVRAGFDGPMDDPVVNVIGFTHTATLGVIEAAVGLLLLISAAMRSRGGAMFFGLVLGVGGIVGAVQTDSFRRSLALESGLAWLAVAAAAVVVLVSLLMPRVAMSRIKRKRYRWETARGGARISTGGGGKQRRVWRNSEAGKILW